MINHSKSKALIKAFLIFATAGSCAATAWAVTSRVDFSRSGDSIIIKSNGIANHATGAFPNPNNPNRISVQNHRFVVDATPEKTGRLTAMRGSLFGVAINGVPLDPGAAEWYNDNPRSGWSYDPFRMKGRLGLDANNAHVQPTGTYHYHGLPTGLMTEQGSGGHSRLIGLAADGFPIYAQYGYTNRVIAEQTSSYRIRFGTRDSGPGGLYDGTFIEDYYYVEGAGSLDACNGKDTVTPEYPNGTYAYFITDEFPYVPRCWVGTPSKTGFEKQRPNNPGANGQRPPPGGSNGQRPRSGNGNPPPPGRDGGGRG